MGIIYDEEYFKPLQCSKCGSRNVVNPINEPYVTLRCIDCGHEKREPMEKHEASANTVWTRPKNPKPYREF